MERFTAILEVIDGYVWGVPLIVLIMGTGILLSVRMGFLQFRKLGKALKYMVHNEEDGEGEVTSFGALTTALAATVGTGNIVGVATAVVTGGPGALFWMIVAACFGMATKYAEGLLAIKYRVIDKDGHALGGPFYYIENGMGEKWKWLAKMFAFFGFTAGVMGIGTITQVNSITSAINTVFDPNNEHIAFSIGANSYSWATLIAAILVTLCVALVIIGGIKRIANVASFVVPAMMITYVVIGVAIILWNITDVPHAIVIIVEEAFGAKAVAGGALGAMMVAMQKGVARGIFSNESGLGSAPIAAAAAQTKEPVRQGLVSMTGTFLDTIVICNITGLSIVLTGSDKAGLEGVAVTMRAFGKGLPWPDAIGGVVLMVCLAIFAYTTILGWDYYGERCLEYFSNRNQKAVKVYRWVYILAVLIGPFLTLDFVWTFADIFNGLMALPNLIGLVALNGVVVAETRSYFKRLDAGEIDEGSKFKKVERASADAEA
ncbi:MAG: sodium:alanine symporter family protein [Mobilibacterium timonense]|uniref:alanine/glycine:cation symporter family protein n=1 Tax=Mobilibacterium timonense TaxID=1871012 RepID=UPI0023528573|nr:sodium:alanine symporter family protein [Mobilibacterium timonense]MBM6991617.1 sodium:alanine symporter family protein [Mobilibacterium timonense]